MNHEKHDEPKGKKHTNFCNENEEDKPKIGAVHCAQMCRKYTPNGKWDTPNVVLGYEETGFQASEHGCRGGVLGVEGREMGGMSPRYAPQIG